MSNFLTQTLRYLFRNLRLRGANRRVFARLLGIEPLESKRLLSIDTPYLDAETSQIVIVGSSDPDSAWVSEETPGIINVRYLSDGAAKNIEFEKSRVDSVAFFGFGGADWFNNNSDVPSLASGGEGNDVLQGGTGADRLFGGPGDDKLYGRAGDDLLDGGDGVDWLYGDEGSDVLKGGEDADELRGGVGDDELVGGNGDDYLSGESGNDRIEGQGGNDLIFGGEGNDTVHGGDGDDKLHGEAGNDYLVGGAGNDWLFGYAGNDTLEGGASNDELRGGDGNDVLRGGEGSDFLSGEDGDDFLYGDQGRDTLYGGKGIDELRGGDGGDTLYGEAGDDFLNGDNGDDLLFGDSGDDQIFGGDGQDVLKGGDGDDQLSGNDGADYLTGEGGHDLLNGDGGNDTLRGSEGNDELRGGDGDDKLYGESGDDFLSAGDGDDWLYGGEGNDIIYGGAGDDELRGGTGNDKLFGNDGRDYLNGEVGDDLLFGGAGDDSLLGGTGNDELRGGSGSDDLRGEEGNDFLNGEDDADWLFGDSGDDLLLGGDADDELRGGDGDDRLYGEAGRDFLSGEDGNDFHYGGAGADQLYGGRGIDALYGEGENDRLYGGDGDDLLDGGDGNDQLLGENGDDLLLGGANDDELYGGSGSDVLVGQDGQDSLHGSVGNDILIGGRGVDHLDGADGQDLLIGAVTKYDSMPSSLWRLQEQWSANTSYHARTTALEEISSDVFLRSGMTVQDDQVSDSLQGGDGDDWFFVTGAFGVYDPLGLRPSMDMGMPHHMGPMASAGHHGGTTFVSSLPALEGFALVDSVDRMLDNQSRESVHSLLMHASDPGMLRGHLSAFQLVRYADVTHSAVKSGAWSDSSTWRNGEIPGPGAKVLITYGVEVNIDRVNTIPLATVRVDGTLSFASNVDTQMRVDTLVVAPTGSLVMGTEERPIDPGVTAKIMITGKGPIDRDWDPFGLSRGVIVHGNATIYGAEKLSHGELIGPAPKGVAQLKLTEVPVGWRPGDLIVIPGVNGGADGDEVREILAINNGLIDIAPLSHDHIPPSSDIPVHVANLTRNVVIESEDTSVEQRGHVMFMHTRDVDVHYAGFYHLGRSNKQEVVNDPVVDDQWNLVPDTGTNPRGRYAVHFHRNGVENDGAPAVVQGSVVTDSAGWGYVNHSSFVEITDNVAYDVKGAAFVTEAGDEIGIFRGNIAISTSGVNEELNARETSQDFGHTGDGFWFQGAGISVVNNVSAGSIGSGFAYYTRGLKFGGSAIAFEADNLSNKTIAEGQDEILVDHVPVREFSGNTAYGGKVGLTVRYHLRNATHNERSVFADSLFWNNDTGVALPYSDQTTLRNLTILNDFANSAHTGVYSNPVTKSIYYENLSVAGYVWGIDVARRGESRILGGKYSNLVNFVINTPTELGRRVEIVGSIKLSQPDNAYANVNMRYVTPPENGGLASLFWDNSVVLNIAGIERQELYYWSQTPLSVPFPSPLDGLPEQYVGLTAQQLWDRFGLAVGGKLADSQS